MRSNIFEKNDNTDTVLYIVNNILFIGLIKWYDFPMISSLGKLLV